MVDVNDLESSDAALTVTLTTGSWDSLTHPLPHLLDLSLGCAAHCFSLLVQELHIPCLISSYQAPTQDSLSLSLLLFWEIICVFGGSLHTVDTDFMLILWARVLVSSGSYLVSFLFSFHGI